jgi:uncharacterized spore protein YtfJ
MTATLESLIERVLGELHRMVKTETIVGEPVEAGAVTLIPVSKISFGFGAGGGSEGKGQTGTGGGASVEPIAFVVVHPDGKTQILPIGDKEGGLGQLAQLMPEALSKVKQFMAKKKEKSIDEDEDPSG